MCISELLNKRRIIISISIVNPLPLSPLIPFPVPQNIFQDLARPIFRNFKDNFKVVRAFKVGEVGADVGGKLGVP